MVKKCEHGHRKPYCRVCKSLGVGGSQICEHNHKQDRCNACKGLGPRVYDTIPIIDGKRTCRTCKTPKDIGEFYTRSKRNSPFGECKVCANLRTVENQKINPARWYQTDVYSAVHSAKKAGVPTTLTPNEWKKVIEDHKYLCYLCGRLLSIEKNKDNTITLEHIIPLSRGGANVKENVAPACFICNSAKRAMTQEEFILLVKRWHEVLCG